MSSKYWNKFTKKWQTHKSIIDEVDEYVIYHKSGKKEWTFSEGSAREVVTAARGLAAAYAVTTRGKYIPL